MQIFVINKQALLEIMEYCFKPIGIIRTEASVEEVKSSYEGVKGYVEVFKDYTDGLRGLAGFSHLILLTYLHETTEDQRHVLVVRPRRLVKLGFSLEELPKVGVFATDSPHRPNPIGLHIVKLESMDGNKLFVSGLDAFNGTPVLDIKPYTASRRIENPEYPEWYLGLKNKVKGEV